MMKVTVRTNNGGKVYFDDMKSAQNYCTLYGGTIEGTTTSGRTANPSTFTMDNGKPAFYAHATCWQRPW